MQTRFLFVGIDPAPRMAGLSFFFPEENRISVNTFSTSTRKGDFVNWFVRSEYIADRIVDTINAVAKPEHMIVTMEYPPPRETFSAALYGLGYLLVSKLKGGAIVLAPPIMLTSLVGKRGRKAGTKELFNRMVELNKFSVQSKLNSHEVDASVLALWAYHNLIQQLKLPIKENGFTCSLSKWKWRIEKIEPLSSKGSSNTSLYNYTGSGDLDASRQQTESAS